MSQKLEVVVHPVLVQRIFTNTGTKHTCKYECTGLFAWCMRSGVTLSDVDAVAVTSGPGLALCLRVGVTAAQRIADNAHVPLLDVNHLEVECVFECKVLFVHSCVRC